MQLKQLVERNRREKKQSESLEEVSHRPSFGWEDLAFREAGGELQVS